MRGGAATGAGRRLRRRGEPVLPLINVVFLLLVFFLIAGQLARPLPADLQLARIDPGALPEHPDALIVTRNGRLYWNGAETALADLPVEGRMRLIPDRALPAAELMALARQLTELGAEDLRISGTGR